MNKFCKLLLGGALAFAGLSARAQGLEGIIVEDYYTITTADKVYIDGLGGDPINVGTKVYRVYVDMAPNYKLNTVFGSPVGGSNNPLSFSTTTSFWNDINNGTEVPAQTRFLDEGGAFDTYITIGRTGASGGAAGCGSNAAQVGVLKTADTNGNLTLCTNYSGWPTSGAGGNADGNLPGTSTALTYNVGGLVNLTALQTSGNSFTVVGDAWATLPNATGVDGAGTNRVLIGQFTTDGVFTFHINVQLQAPGGALESYVWNQAGSGEVVKPFLTYPQPVTGCSSSQDAYLKPLGAGNTTTSILTVGDAIGGYQMVGIPDGLGAFDNGNGTFTLLMNHELQNAGAVRAHGAIGAFVSKWVIDKSSLCVQSGQDLMQTVMLWNGTSFVPSPGTAFARFCSADLPAVSAFYNAGTGKGTQERIFMNGEESGNEGRAMGHIVTGPNAGTSYQLPRLGRASWENSVANPASGDKTVVGEMDDTSPTGQVYFYIGTKQSTGTEIDKAGLNNGNLYGVVVSGLSTEVTGSVPAPGTAFSLVSLGNVANITGAQLNTNSNTAGVTLFLRPEDGSWDPRNPSDFYFNTTDAFTAPSRLWKLHFTDILHPELGGTITAVLDGTEGQKMLDNIGIGPLGRAYLCEDVGAQAHDGKLWSYNFATDALTQVAFHDSSRFITGGSNFLTIDEESSGIIDMQSILGKGKYFLDVQAHYASNPTLVEGGQLLQFATGDTIEPCQPPVIASITGAQTLCSLDTLHLDVAASGTPDLSYSWSGTGSFLFGSSSASALLTGAATGSYTVTVSNSCGSVNGTVNVTVNPAGTYYADTDGDGFGAGAPTVACTQPVGFVANNTDLCPTDASKQAPGICGCGVADTDSDNDGTANCIDGCPNDPNKIAPGICGCGVADTDSDNDGTADCNDGCPSDPNKIAPGICGCGVADTDTDSDGTADCNDGCPNDPNKIAPGICGCGIADTDTDSDGTANCNDGCPNDPNKIAPGACGCGVADVAATYYADADGDGLGDPASPLAGFTCSTPAGYVSNNTDLCPLVSGTVGSACDDGNVNTINDVLNASCVCVGTPVGGCTQNEVTLSLTTDASASQISWSIVNGGTNTVVCSGGGYANNSTITATCCLPNGCYDLRVMDSFGDGINPGGYELRDASDRTIINNVGNGNTFTSLSEVRDGANVPQSFCVPLGTDALVGTSCGVENATINTVLQAAINPAVAGGAAATSGYQFWVFNPNGGYSRRIFQSVTTPGSGYPVGTPVAQRPAYFKLSAMSTAPAIPSFTLLNVRVRARVNGLNAEYGAACRLKIDPTANCQTTQLTTTATPIISCGAANVSRTTGVLWSNAVAGANKYKFEFVNANTNVLLRRIAVATRNLNMSAWGSGAPLPTCGVPYNVRVSVSFDGGTTYCSYGNACQVTFTGCPAMQLHDETGVIAAEERMTMWPNPNNGDLLNLRIAGLKSGSTTATVDLFDIFGKRVHSEVVAVSSVELNTVIKLDASIAKGLYMVTVTAGEESFTQRLIIQ